MATCAMAAVCPYCIEQEYIAPSKSLLLGHIRVVHSADPDFTIQCIDEGCSRTFKNFRTYQNHNLLHHSTEEQDEEAQLQPLCDLDVGMSDDAPCESTSVYVPDEQKCEIVCC